MDVQMYVQFQSQLHLFLYKANPHIILYFILSWYGCVLQAQIEVVLAPALIRKIESCQSCCTMCMKNQAHSETFSAQGN